MWAKMQRTIWTRAKRDDDDGPGWEMKIRSLALVAPFQFQGAGYAKGKLEGLSTHTHGEFHFEDLEFILCLSRVCEIQVTDLRVLLLW